MVPHRTPTRPLRRRRPWPIHRHMNTPGTHLKNALQHRSGERGGNELLQNLSFADVR